MNRYTKIKKIILYLHFTYKWSEYLRMKFFENNFVVGYIYFHKIKDYFY